MTEEKYHYIRLVTLTVEGCPQPLWGLFEKKANLDTRPGTPFTDFDSYLAFYKSLAQHMLNKRYINQKQFGLLYTATPVDITNWDITLASTMLHNFFKPLPSNEQSYIDDIRQVRNDLHHIAGSAEVDEPTFRRYWITLRQSTLGLASLVSPECCNTTKEYIDALRYKPLPTPGGVLEILKKWYLLDKERENGAKNILNDTIVRSTNRAGAVTKKMKVADLVLDNMKKAMANTITQTDLTDFEPPPEILRIQSELRDQHKVVVAGYGNSKHLETCLYAIKDMGYNLDRCVQITGSEECHHICCEDVDIILCLDPFGKDIYNTTRAKAVCNNVDQILQLTQLADAEARIEFMLSTSQTVLNIFKDDNDHELLDNVVTINKPTTENEPHFVNDGKQRQTTDTKGNVATALLEQSMVYIGHLQQRYPVHPMLNEAKHMFQKHKVVVLVGAPSSRSDILAANLMTAYQSDQCIVLNRPSDWKRVKLSQILVILITEFTGKFKFDESLTTKWLTQFDIILAAVREGKLNVIITSRQEYLDRCLKEISNHDLLQHVISLDTAYTAQQIVKIEPETSTDEGHTQNRSDSEVVDPHHSNQSLQFVGRCTVQLQGSSVTHFCPVSRGVFLVVVHVKNSTIYRLNSSYQEIDNLNLKSAIHHLVRMADQMAAVNVGGQSVHLVHLGDTMQVINKINTEHVVSSCDFQNDEIFMKSSDDKTIRIDVYNVQRSLLRTIPTGIEQLSKFTYKGVAVRNERIVLIWISSEKNCIACLKMNGDLIWRSNITNISNLYSLTTFIIDEDNNVIIPADSRIVKVSPCGQHQSTIIDLKQFGVVSARLGYSRELSRLYITDMHKGDVHVYDYMCK